MYLNWAIGRASCSQLYWISTVLKNAVFLLIRKRQVKIFTQAVSLVVGLMQPAYFIKKTPVASRRKTKEHDLKSSFIVSFTCLRVRQYLNDEIVYSYHWSILLNRLPTESAQGSNLSFRRKKNTNQAHMLFDSLYNDALNYLKLIIGHRNSVCL